MRIVLTLHTILSAKPGQQGENLLLKTLFSRLKHIFASILWAWENILI